MKRILNDLQAAEDKIIFLGSSEEIPESFRAGLVPILQDIATAHTKLKTIMVEMNHGA